MSRKELSPYAPDRWIREMNRRYPSLWTDLRKGYVDPGRIIRQKSGTIKLLSGVPDWCIMPTLFPFLVMTDKYGEQFYLTHMDELMTMGSTYIWRCSKGVYRFAPEVYQALIRQPLSGDLPQECLYHLPEWTVYIETPGPPMSESQWKASSHTWTATCSVGVSTCSSPFSEKVSVSQR